jgi:NAD(P)-dependent dehydrogenase (short-subunit alcohol dehydrogenase family)
MTQFATHPSLESEAVVITGGASGIGASIVEHLSGQGARVGVLDIDADAGRALASNRALPSSPSTCATSAPPFRRRMGRRALRRAPAGTPRTISDDDVQRIVVQKLEEKPTGRTHSIDLLPRHADIEGMAFRVVRRLPPSRP